ncbi:MAG: hypothetical protein V1738_05325 [Patescibacteria group bacterium]
MGIEYINLAERKEHGDEPGNSPDFSEFPCNHRREQNNQPITLIVREQKVELIMPVDIPLCSKCFAEYLSKYSTTCGKCGGIILPGEKVAERPFENNPRTLVHLSVECSLYGDNWCGIWGQGRLVSLHELYPQLFPAGTRRAVDLKKIHDGRCLFGLGDQH